MKYIYKVIIPIYILLVPYIIYAQSQENLYQDVRDELDDMFRNLDKSRVPTGYLLDYAVDLVDMFLYSGDELTDENYVNIDIYQDVLSSVRSASLYEEPFGNPAEIIRDFQSLPDVSISMAAFNYNYIRSNALDDNLINYNESTGRVSDRFVGNNWVNPYVENAVFCFVPNKPVVTSLTVSFRFPAAYTFTNLDISDIYFDPGDGNGFRPVTSSSQINVTYSSYGEKELLVQMFTEDGDYVCDAHSKIFVCEEDALDIPTKGSSETSSDDEAHFSTNYNGEIVNAQMSCYYIPGNTGITKPFIVAEGFDPWIFNYMLDDTLQEDVHLGFTNHESFHFNCWAGSVLQNKYDLIYIDWDDSLVDIRANAQLFVQIIERVNQMKASSGSSEKNVVMGQSMGGLVARYALRDMELQSKSHNTSTFISHDSPHWGANVPLGALYFVRQLISFAHGFDTSINIYDLFAEDDLTVAEQRLYSVLNAQSVKQMLVNHVGDSGIDNSVHESWLQTLDTYGFPVQTENIAIVNGGQYDRTSVLGGGNHFLYFKGYVKSSPDWDVFSLLFMPVSLLSQFIDLFGPLDEAMYLPGSTKLNIHAEVNPLSTSNVGSVMSKLNINYVKRFLWIFPITFSVYSSTQYVPYSGLYYDDYPGSFYTLGKDELSPPTDTTYSESNAIGEYSLIHKMANKIMFIPTASALAINSNGGLASSQYMHDYFNDPPAPEIETPFSAYVLAATSEGHIHINNNVFNWLDSQLHARIDGPDTLSSSANYNMSGYTGPVQWKISDNSKATIDDDGRLTATGRGGVKIYAESYINGQLIRKTKNVMIGMPDLAISYNFSPGSGHMFQMTAPDSEDADIIDELVKAGYFKYEWSILRDNEDMITTVSTNRSITHFPEEDETVTVCLRLVDDNGNKSETYSRTINLQNPFSINYKYVEVNALGSVRFIRENGYETGMPNEDLIITFRNIIYSSEDNIFALILKYIQGNVCYLAYPNGVGTTYLAGTKLMAQDKWRFTFLETQMFADALQDVINRAGGTSIENGEIVDFNISICNANKKLMQRIPFAIVYKSL